MRAPDGLGKGGAPAGASENTVKGAVFTRFFAELRTFFPFWEGFGRGKVCNRVFIRALFFGMAFTMYCRQ